MYATFSMSVANFFSKKYSAVLLQKDKLVLIFLNYVTNSVLLFLFSTAINVLVSFLLRSILFHCFSQPKYFAPNITTVLLPHFNSFVSRTVCTKVHEYMWKCFVSYSSSVKGLHVYTSFPSKPRELKKVLGIYCINYLSKMTFYDVIFSSDCVLKCRKE